MSNLEELMNDARYNAHSEFQMDFFITGKSGGTDYGMYRQALRELSTRVASMKNFHLQRRELEIDLEEAERKLESRWGLFWTSRKRVELFVEKTRLSLVFLDRQIQECARELRRFWSQAYVLKKRVGDVSPERRYEEERKMFRVSLLRRLVTDVAGPHRCANVGTVDLFYSMPLEDQKKLAPAMTDQDSQKILMEEELEGQLTVETLAQLTQDHAAEIESEFQMTNLLETDS